MESIRFGMTIHNTNVVTAGGVNAALEPLLSATAMFQRFRLYVAGTLVEDIVNCGTLTATLERLKCAPRRYNDAMELGHSMLGGATADAYIQH